VPKRSNTFQKVIYLVKSHMADGVTESTELTDLVTGEPREVDVVIEGEIAGEALIVGIECRDHKRAQAVGWVDEMRGKHEHLPTNRLVLVSSSGFTRQARNSAEKANVVTVTPSDLKDDGALEIIGKITRLGYKQLHLEGVTSVLAMVEANELEPSEIVTTNPDWNIFLASGEYACSMEDLVRVAFERAPTPELIRDADPETKTFVIEIDPVRHTDENGDNHDLFLQKIDPEPHLRRILRIRIEGPAGVIASEFEMTPKQLQDTAYAYGESEIDGKKALIVITESDDKKAISLNIEDKTF
jgi:hypothetical protein